MHQRANHQRAIDATSGQNDLRATAQRLRDGTRTEVSVHAVDFFRKRAVREHLTCILVAQLRQQAHDVIATDNGNLEVDTLCLRNHPQRIPTRARIQPAGIRQHLHATLRNHTQILRHRDADEIGGVTHRWILSACARQDRQGRLGEVVVNQVVQRRR